MTTVATDRPMSHIEGFINESRGYNSDLRSTISRFDALCTKLGHNNYSKNQLQKEEVGTPVKTSDGIMEDLGEIIRQKDQLMVELRVAVDYLEQHI